MALHPSSSLPPKPPPSNPWSSSPTSRFQPRPPAIPRPANAWATPGSGAKVLIGASNINGNGNGNVGIKPPQHLPLPPQATLNVLVAPSTPGPSEEADEAEMTMPLDIETPELEREGGKSEWEMVPPSTTEDGSTWEKGPEERTLDSGIGMEDEGRAGKAVEAVGAGVPVSREEFNSLLERVSKTESTLTTLTAQVTQLTAQFASLSTTPIPSTTSTPVSSSTPTPAPALSQSSDSLQLQTLTHQITALSTSVAQLQRMQSSNVRAGMEERARSSSGTLVGEIGGPGQGVQGEEQNQEGGRSGNGPTQSDISALSSLGGPNIRPQPQNQGFQPFSPNQTPAQPQPQMNTGAQSALMTHHLQRQESMKAGAPGQGMMKRPMTPRSGASYQTAMNGPGGPGSPVNANNLHQLGSLGLPGRGRPGLGRSISNGGAMGAQVGPNGRIEVGAGRGDGGNGPDGNWASGAGGLNLGNILSSLPNNNNRSTEPTTPGAPGTGTGPGGLMVNKWEHLALSGDVLRMIQKYGIGPPNKIQSRALPFMLKGMDIIAQAPPTQERIIAYVVPVVQMCLNLGLQQTPYKGPNAVLITTTVDQATQAHKLIRDLGAPLGIRSALLVGAGGADISSEVRMMVQNSVQVVVGTPAKVHDLFVKNGGAGGMSGGDVRMLVLDEVDQLIARNLYEYVISVVKLFPTPRTRSTTGGNLGVIGTPAIQSPGVGGVPGSPFDPGMSSPFNPSSQTPFPATSSRFGTPTTPANGNGNGNGNGGGSGAVGSVQAPPVGGGSNGTAERQTCLFSNTIPTDVINFSQAIQVREPVRVLVRREGGATQTESSQSGALRHYYLYLALATNSRAEQVDTGPGTIGSGRSQPPSAVGGPVEGSNPAREWKLEALADLLEDYPLWQAVVHVGSQATLEAVVNKLNSRQLETVYLMPDMTPALRQATLNKWRLSCQSGRGPRFLVAFDLVVKTPEVPPSPLVINFDLPRSVEGYAQRVAAASVAPSRGGQNQPSPSSVILNFILPNGGDVEMLRSTECAYRFKCSEIPSSIRDLF